MRLILVITFINNTQIRIVHCIDASCSLSVGAAVELYRVTESIHSFSRKSGWQTLKRDALETTWEANINTKQQHCLLLSTKLPRKHYMACIYGEQSSMKIFGACKSVCMKLITKSPPVLSKLDPFVSTDGIFVSGRQASWPAASYSITHIVDLIIKTRTNFGRVYWN